MHPEVLYIHPAGHLNDLAVPAGSLSCLNAVTVPKLGRYAFEVDDAEIRAACVVAMDLHWAVALPGFVRLVRHVRAVNPDAAIVAGGITAGHYARDLLERHPVDFVVQGDSEVAFTALVDALLAGRDPTGIPNVFARGAPDPVRRRMTNAEFDRTDCLTCDWFPTFARVTNWDAEAFGQGRTVPVSRGCPMRCLACYGSYASTFGPGYRVRSPEGLAAVLGRARDEGVRNLRLILGKVPAGTLARLLEAAAKAGPFDLDTTLGLYLCTPPSPEDLDRLEATFRNRVALSMIPPEEHLPRLSPAALAAEMARWREVVGRVGRSRVLNLDAWATTTVDVDRLRRDLGAVGTPGATVSLGSVWNVTRPTDTGERPALDALEAAMDPVWTFYAARLLSPPLARALAPFRFLDEIPGDPEDAPAPTDSAAPWWPAILASWRRHRLPLPEGIRFAAVPVRAGAAARLAAGTRLAGDLAAGRVVRAGDAVVLHATADHRGMRLAGEVVVPPGADALAIVALPPGDGAISSSGAAPASRPAGLPASGGVPPAPADAPAVLADEVVFLRCPPGAGTLEVTLRVQDAGVAWLGPGGEPRARGRADLGYFRAPRPGRGG